jgi:NAD dependent epimerase/dehydratase family enzyme
MPAHVNLCTPHPASNAELSAAIAKALHRPNLFTMPKFGLKALFGEGAETILTGQFAVPGVLAARGFSFAAPQLPAALAAALA